MGGTQTLTPESWSDAAAVRQACPRCDEPWDDAQPVVTSHFADRPLRCCRRCGCHFTAGESPFRLIRTCDRCSLPFLTDDPIVNDEPRCPDCCSGRTPSDLLDPSVTSATEAEVRLALQEQWSFVTSESLSTYLGAVTRQLAREVRGAAESARVELINDADVKTLALPSGVLLISLGMLASLEDEAELAFVIAHELAHSSGDAAIRLVRLGLQAVAREQESTGRRIWARAANDLVALGYGRRREREADAKALKALLGLDYDPRSAARYLVAANRVGRLRRCSLDDGSAGQPRVVQARRGTLGPVGQARPCQGDWRRSRGDRERAPHALGAHRHLGRFGHRSVPDSAGRLGPGAFELARVRSPLAIPAALDGSGGGGPPRNSAAMPSSARLARSADCSRE
jgi:hypothetical protein